MRKDVAVAGPAGLAYGPECREKMVAAAATDPLAEARRHAEELAAERAEDERC